MFFMQTAVKQALVESGAQEEHDKAMSISSGEENADKPQSVPAYSSHLNISL